MPRLLSRLAVLTLSLALWLGPAAHAQLLRDYNHVISLAMDASGSSVLLHTGKPAPVQAPRIQYLQGDEGQVTMLADFPGLVWDHPTAVIFPRVPGIRQVRIGQFQAQPPICRLSISAYQAEILARLAFHATAGSLVIKWPTFSNNSGQLHQRQAAGQESNSAPLIGLSARALRLHPLEYPQLHREIAGSKSKYVPVITDRDRPAHTATKAATKNPAAKDPYAAFPDISTAGNKHTAPGFATDSTKEHPTTTYIGQDFQIISMAGIHNTQSLPLSTSNSGTAATQTRPSSANPQSPNRQLSHKPAACPKDSKVTDSFDIAAGKSVSPGGAGVPPACTRDSRKSGYKAERDAEMPYAPRAQFSKNQAEDDSVSVTSKLAPAKTTPILLERLPDPPESQHDKTAGNHNSLPPATSLHDKATDKHSNVAGTAITPQASDDFGPAGSGHHRAQKTQQIPDPADFRQTALAITGQALAVPVSSRQDKGRARSTASGKTPAEQSLSGNPVPAPERTKPSPLKPISNPYLQASLAPELAAAPPIAAYADKQFSSAPRLSISGTCPTEIQISAPRPLLFQSMRIERPSRYVIDFQNYPEMAGIDIPRVPVNSPLRSMRSGHPENDPSITRLVFDLDADNVQVEEKLSHDNSMLVLLLSSPAAAMPVLTLPKGTTLVIDAGHGGSDPGAQRGTVQEKEITLGITNRLKTMLEQAGARVKMTRFDDSFVSLEDRVNLSVAAHPDAFISVHINSLEANTSIYGIETYYQTEQSKKLAQCIHDSLVAGLKAPDRCLRKARFYVINHTPIPSVLAEVGFISNPEERQRLISSDYQNEVAKCLAQGIIAYVTGKPSLPSPSISKRVGTTSGTQQSISSGGLNDVSVPTSR